MRRAISPTTAMLALASILLAATPALAAYGAMAWDNETHKAGWSWNKSTPKSAAEAALSECGASGCKVIMKTGAGMCSALATTETGKFYGMSARKTKDEARLAALAACKREGKAGDCIIKASDCNK